MKRNNLLLLLLLCTGTLFADPSCAPTCLVPNQAVTVSGCYCLCENFTTPISIEANDVTIDLNCHSVQAGDAITAAIEADGYSNITIKNGSVSNTSGVAVMMTSCSDVRLEELNINSSVVGSVFEEVTGFTIERSEYTLNTRALLITARFDGNDVFPSTNGTITHCHIYDNTSVGTEETTGGSIVDISQSGCIDFDNVTICGNTNNTTELTFDNLSYAAAIVNVFMSSSVNFSECSISDNTSTVRGLDDPEYPGNPLYAKSALIPFNSSFSMDCSFTHGYINQNHVDDGVIFILQNFTSPNFRCTHSQLNQNQVTMATNPRPPGDSFIIATLGIDHFFGNNLIVDTCQINDNGVFGNDPNLLYGAFCYGIRTLSDGSKTLNTQTNNLYSAFETIGQIIVGNDGLIKGCQANNLTSDSVTFGVRLAGFNNLIIDCQASDNFALGTPVPEFGNPGGAFGFASLGVAGNTYENCEAHNNISEFSIGLGFITAGGDDTRFINCSAYGTRGTDSFILSDFGITIQTGGIVLLQANRGLVSGANIYNTTGTADGKNLPFGVAGISIIFCNDVSVIDSTVFDTKVVRDPGEDTIFAAGISVEDSNRVSIENCITNGSTATGNKAYGIVLKGETTDSSVNDSKSVGNQYAGFADLTKCKNFFYGNYAEKNHKNYTGGRGPIATFNKHNGKYNRIPNRWSNVSVVTKCPDHKKHCSQ